nr:hypothetical protein [Tanacetum cinerariifolium]
KLDEEVARQLEAELNANVDWNVVIEQVQRKEKLTDAVMKYQALKRKPLTEAQARRNMIIILIEKILNLFGIFSEKDLQRQSQQNYSDDFLLNTLKIMFEKPNVEANVWKDQKGNYGLAKIFLLVERMYPLTHFTLEQMMNDVKLEVEDESEMSLELLRLVRRQLNEGYVPQ